MNNEGEKIGDAIAKGTGVLSCKALVGERDKNGNRFKQDSFKWGVGKGRLWECAGGTSKNHNGRPKQPHHGKRYWIEMVTEAISNDEFASVKPDPSSEVFHAL